MTKKSFPFLSSEHLYSLKQSLRFLHVEELKNICLRLHISDKGKKGNIIARIIYFMSTGEEIVMPKIPAISKAKKGESYHIHPNTLILKGAYKNDLKTRFFFKELIGEYFHFTAFGIDWINDRWLAGNPPTYGEFANMWKDEYARRKKFGTAPKEEWAYINFTQKFIISNPNATRAAIIQAWETERKRNSKIIHDIIDIYIGL